MVNFCTVCDGKDAKTGCREGEDEPAVQKSDSKKVKTDSFIDFYTSQKNHTYIFVFRIMASIQLYDLI